MSEVIIDTNVAVVANRQNSQVVQNCIDNCILRLARAKQNDVILLDDAGEILSEYARALRLSRPYQLGGQFLVHVIQQQYNTNNVRRVALRKNDIGAFVDLPPLLHSFDPSDKKFAVLSIVTGVAVTNAIDSDWVHRTDDLRACGVAIDFLCGNSPDAWFA